MNQGQKNDMDKLTVIHVRKSFSKRYFDTLMNNRTQSLVSLCQSEERDVLNPSPAST